MNLNLFACTGGGYLVTPDCMLASSESQALHGANARFLGQVDSALLPDAMRLQVESEIDVHAYAFVEQEAGDEVLAIRRTVHAGRSG